MTTHCLLVLSPTLHEVQARQTTKSHGHGASQYSSMMILKQAHDLRQLEDDPSLESCRVPSSI